MKGPRRIKVVVVGMLTAVMLSVSAPAALACFGEVRVPTTDCSGRLMYGPCNLINKANETLDR